MLSSIVVYKNEKQLLSDFLKNNGITIIKPADDDEIKTEYIKMLSFMSSNYRAISNESMDEDEASVRYEVYKNILLVDGEKSINEMLIGPPDDEVSVLLNKYSKVVFEDQTVIQYLYNIDELIKSAKE